MKKKGKRGSSQSPDAEEYALAWRKFLKELLNAKVRTKDERERLAAKLGVSIHYINSMLYRQQGGIDAWASALSIAYNLDLNDVGGFFALLKSSLQKITPLTKSDEVWQKLDELVTENEKFYWVSMLHALIATDRELGQSAGGTKRAP